LDGRNHSEMPEFIDLPKYKCKFDTPVEYFVPRNHDKQGRSRSTIRERGFIYLKRHLIGF